MAFNDFMHERNIYKERPDFRQIAIDYPELRKYAIPNDRGKVHVDFTSPEALRIVTKILLKKDFNLLVEIPRGFLIPTVPQRLNYILWIEDLLNALPTENKTISGIDVGTGPCAIFSLLGAQKNAWKFLSTDTSDEAIEWAEKNIKANNLESQVKVVKVSKDSILKEVLSSNGAHYDFCLCNPPFFDNIEEIRRKHPRVKETLPEITKESEIVADGGEVAFVRRMIEDSITYKDRVSLYTSMFGKKKSFLQILKDLESVGDATFTKTEFCQGNTVRWGIAWTFLKGIKFVELKKPKLPKPLKAKPPLTMQIPLKKETVLHIVKKLSQRIRDILMEFEIQFRLVKSYENYVEMLITSEKNTWSNQRRKRRQLRQDKNENLDAPASGSSEPANKIKIEPIQSIEKDSGVGTSSANSDQTIIDPLSLHSSDITQCQSSKKEDSVAENETVNVTPDCASIDNCKKRKVNEDNIEPCKKAKLDLKESSCSSKCGLNSKTDSDEAFVDHSPDVTQSKVSSEEDLIAVNKAVTACDTPDSTDINNSKKRKVEGDNIESYKKAKLNLNESGSSSKYDSNSQIDDDRFQRCSLLYGCLKLIKCKNHISLEMNCPPDANRETLHQVFQLLKNKLVV